MGMSRKFPTLLSTKHLEKRRAILDLSCDTETVNSDPFIDLESNLVHRRLTVYTVCITSAGVHDKQLF